VAAREGLPGLRRGMNDGTIIVYRSEYEQVRDQFLFHDDNAAAILLVAILGVLLVAFLYGKWEEWAKQRKRRKDLHNDS
jgi:hypothetical protein